MSSYNRYFSPAQVESDQKDLVVSQLKAEIFELRQNERDYVELASQLRNLEHRYNLLQEEKIRSEAEFKARNDSNFKTIANLKTDVDTLKSSIAENNIEYQELKAENLTIKDIADHRALEINKLKNELQDALDQHNRLRDELRSLETQISIARDEKRNLINNYDVSQGDGEELNFRCNELEKVIRELEYEKSRVEKLNSNLQGSIDNLSNELRNKELVLKDSDAHVAEAQRNILALEADVKDLERLNEKNRAEAIQQQRSHQSEVSRHVELSAKANSLDNTLRSREIQSDDIRRELENLKRAQANLLDQNFQLNSDLDTIRRHIDNMTGQNQELVHELERFSEQDEQVRSILNRRSRVNELRIKAEGSMKQSVAAIRETSQSPRRTPYRTPNVRGSPRK